ncbi:hypothetical protein WA158_001354 [Blastocystis sp. Blastoise]
MTTEVTSEIITGPKNEGGIPSALFIEDIPKFCEEKKIMPDLLLTLFRELYEKYKFMETNLKESHEAILSKIPENDKSIQAVKMLIEKRDEENIKTTFNMSHNLFVNASIKPTDKCCVWLGANVLVEVTLDEAITLLNKIESALKENENELNRDIDFISAQSNVIELNMTRTYNFMVKIKQQVVKNNL